MLCAIKQSQFRYQNQTIVTRTIFLSVMIPYHDQPTAKSRFLSIKSALACAKNNLCAKNNQIV